MFANGIECTSSTTGTGALTLSAVSNRVDPTDVFGTSGTRLISYAVCDDTNGQYEWGIGTLTLSSLSLARTKIKATFDGGTYDATNPSAVNFGATKTVYLAPLADDFMPTMPFVSVSSPSGSLGLASWHAPVQAATHAPTTNVEYYSPFLWLGQGDVVQAGIRCTTNEASKNAKLAIYEIGTDGLPGKKLYDLGTFSLASTGDVVSTSSPMPFYLPPGWYYFGFISDATSAQVRAYSSAPMQSPLAGVSGQELTGASKSGSYATGLPDPASTSLTALNGVSLGALFLKPRNT